MIIKTRNPSDKKALINSPIIMFLLRADQHLYNLLLLNALLDPIVYAIRIREVRVGYIRLFCRWKCCHKLPFIKRLYQQAYEESTQSRQSRIQSFTFNTDLNSSLSIKYRTASYKQNSYSSKDYESNNGKTTLQTLI